MRSTHAIAIVLLASLALPAPARADDFPNDVKRTFTTDIPHFFQDDIPCAFGGKPTSGAKTSCKGGSQPAATAHKAATHKKKHKAAAHAATRPAASTAATGDAGADQAGAGANAGATAGAPAAASPAAK